MVSKRLLALLVSGCTVLVLAVLPFIAACPASEEEKTITLNFANFDVPASFTGLAHQALADEIEERTDGKYKVEIAWGAAMGKTEEHYTLVRDGVADIGYFLTALTPGVFPISDMLSLPWVLPDASISVPAFWEFYKMGYLDDEYAEVKPLFAWTGPGNVCFTAQPATTLADLEGRKLISHSEINNEVITKALKGTPVFIPHGEMYGAVQKGTVDGLYFVWCGIAPFNLHEVVHYAIEPAFGNVGCVVAMNKDSYNELPEDVQSVIDEIVEDSMLPLTIQGYGDAEALSRQAFADTGGTVTEFSSADKAEIASIVSPMWEEWIAANEAKGLPAREAVDALWAILKDLGVDEPAIGYTPGE
jgi:TRAP-type C4-dicarboxylate transport system substrate-binding protein